MKSMLTAIFCLMMMAGTIAQDAQKAIKTVNKNIGKFNIDPTGSAGLLEESITVLDEAFKSEVVMNDPEAWNTKGQLFNEISKSEINAKVIKPDYVFKHPDASLIAFEAFQTGMAKALKKFHTKDALAGIRENEDYLNNTGIFYFQEQNYDAAFKFFEASLKAYDVLKNNKADSRLDEGNAKTDQEFYTGVSAYYGSDNKKALPYFESLVAKGNAQVLVYVGLFTIFSETDETKAFQYLDEAKKLYPDENEVLFAEINFYIKTNRLDDLVNKLKLAIEKEPENVSVYNALGNVYDQLNQKERTAGNSAKADEYFNSALDYFMQVTKKDPKNFDAVYSTGALYYNKAASMVDELNKLSNDLSAAGFKKYDAKKAEMDKLFSEALPYFLQAETLNDKDLNTVIAIKEIYARQGKLEKSSEYKAKMDALSGN